MVSPFARRIDSTSFKTLTVVSLGFQAVLAFALAWLAWLAWSDLASTRLSLTANRMADRVIEAAAQQALERGATATAISNPGAAPAALKQRIETFRRVGDAAWTEAEHIAGELARDSSTPARFGDLLAQAREDRAALAKARADADAVLGGQGRGLNAEQWIRVATNAIKSGARLRQITFSHRKIRPEISYANQVIKQQLWLASEFAGQERANVSALINSNVPAVSSRLNLLRGLRATVDENLGEVLRLKTAADLAPPIASAIEDMERRFLREFEFVRRTVLADAEQEKDDGAARHYSLSAEEWFNASTQGIDSILAVATAVSAASTAEVEALLAASQRRLILTSLGLAITLMAMIAFVGMLLRKLRRLETLQQTMASLAGDEGDLTCRLDAGSGDELGRTAAAFNAFVGKLQDITRDALAGVGEVGQAVSTVARDAESLSQRAAEQARTAAAASGLVERMAAEIAQMADFSRETAEVSRNEESKAAEGDTVVQRFAAEMEAIATSFTETTDNVSALGRRSEQIGSVASTIKEIADQTNLLALNAAIEAARAGEQGRGFAVVADEVRKLAERTTSATAEIATMIASIQAGTSEVLSGISANRERLGHGVDVARKTASTLQEIRSDSKQVLEKVRSIATATEAQRQHGEEVRRNVEAITAIARENGQSADQTSAAARRLDEVARALADLLGRFRV
jgi:methyl-accepting chemotaxis protein